MILFLYYSKSFAVFVSGPKLFPAVYQYMYIIIIIKYNNKKNYNKIDEKLQKVSTIRIFLVLNDPIWK